MKLRGILAAALFIAAPGAAAAQAHGGTAAGAAHAGVGRFAAADGAGAHAGAARVAFHSGRFDDHPGVHDRFHRRDFLVGLYPYWGWSGCGLDADCDWDQSDPPGVTPADYTDPPAGSRGYMAAASPHRASVNECSDWVWRADLRRSVCRRPYRG